MRDEHDMINAQANGSTSPNSSSQGLTQKEKGHEMGFGGLDRSASLTLARKSLKVKGSMSMTSREVSERRQVGDAESMMLDKKAGQNQPWWRNVTMEEGL